MATVMIIADEPILVKAIIRILLRKISQQGAFAFIGKYWGAVFFLKSRTDYKES